MNGKTQDKTCAVRRGSRPVWLALSLALCLWTTAGMSGTKAATATESKSAEGHRLFTLENQALKVVLDLNAGARIVSYTYAPFKKNIVFDVGSSGGMLMDHVWEQTWPGEFLNRAYDGEVVKAGPDQAVVRVWTEGKGDTIKGLRLERTLTLTGEARLLHCRVALHNPGTDGRVTGYWSQNNFSFGGKEGMTWARPATRAVDELGITQDGNHWQTYSGYYVDDVTAGWNGAFNRQRQEGVMFLMNYNDLWRIYDNTAAVTTEWMYDKVAIPGGKTWTTDIAVMPTKGMRGFKYGGHELVANFVVEEEAGGLKITHELTQGQQPLKDVTVKTRAWGLKEKWQVETEGKVTAVDETVAVLPAKLTGSGAMPIGIEVTVAGTGADGKPVQVKYADYYGGIIGVNNDPFSMQPWLKFDRPPKQKVFLKPDVIAYKPNAKPRVLFLRGIWSEVFKADEALKAAFPDVTVDTGWLRASPVGLGLSMFPADYPSLLSYDLIVLGNIPAQPLDLVGQEMLADYLQAGGNVLLLGGDRAYGQGEFTNQALLAALPVEVGTFYNWRQAGADSVLKVSADVPATAGVQFGTADKVFFRHLCAPRAGATVAVKAGEAPILVLAQSPKGGRIAGVLATPFGEAAAGETAFWDSPGWQKLMQNTVAWLIRH